MRQKTVSGMDKSNEENAAELLRNMRVQPKHEKLRTEVLDYMIDHDDDPIELLKQFAERLLVLIGCDQVTYRDLEETIHYVQDYHPVNDVERNTLEVFARILSISLSRYNAKKQAGELNIVKRSLNMMFSLSDQFDPIIILNPKTGEYDWMMSKAQEIEDLTSMSIHGTDLYKNIAVDSETIIHEDERKRFRAFYTRENMMKIAETGEGGNIKD